MRKILNHYGKDYAMSVHIKNHNLSPSKSGVIVLGGHVQGYGLVRLFGEIGVKSLVIDSTKANVARYSKYCVGHHEMGYNEVLSFLIRAAKGGMFSKWIVVPTDDYYVKLLSTNFDVLKVTYHLLVDTWDKVELFYDKNNSYPWVKELGIPVPETFYPEDEENVSRIAEHIEYPCIIKPAIMKDFYALFKSKVLICRSKDELIEQFKEVVERLSAHDVMIQEIIPGSSENQYSVGVFSIEGEIQNSLIARRRRQHPPDFGNATTYAETADAPLLLEYAKKIMRASGYNGVCEIEFKYDSRSDEYKFLEVNPRFWKWHLLAKPANVQLVKSINSFFSSGEALPNETQNEASWQDVITDIPTIVNMKMKKLYTKADKRKNIHAIFNMSDPLPFLMQLIHLPYIFKTRR